MKRSLLVLSVVLLALALWAQDSEASPLRQTVPGAPTGLNLAAEINNSGYHVISVSWTAPTSPSSDPINSYSVEWRLSGSEDDLDWESRYTNNTSTAYRIGEFGGLVNSKYEVRVSAWNSAGQGPFVTPKTVETVGYQTPTISVTGSTLREDGSDSLIISIDPAPAGDIEFDYRLSKESGDTAIVGDSPPLDIYSFSGSTTSSDFNSERTMVTLYPNVEWESIDEDDETVTLILSNLSGIDSMFEGGGSTLKTTITIIDDDDAPGPPRRLRAIAWQTGIELIWDEPADLGQENGFANFVSEYEYRSATTESGVRDAGWTGTGSTSTSTYVSFYDENNNIADGIYYIQVRAKTFVTDDDGNTVGAASNVAVSTQRWELIFTPGWFNPPEGGSQGVKMKLNSQPTADVTVAISKSGTSSAEITLDTSSLTFTAGNYNTDQTITVSAAGDTDADDDMASIDFKLTSTDDNFNGKDAKLYVLIEDDETALEPPANFDLTAGQGILVASWDAMDGAASYTITWRCGSGGARSHTTDDGTATSYTIPNLANGTECSVSMKANGTKVDGGTLDSPSTAALTATPVERVIFSGTPLSLHETGDDVFGEYTIVLKEEPTADVTITVASSDDDAVEPSVFGDELTFTADDWDTPQTIYVTAQFDFDPYDEHVTMKHTLTSDDSRFDGLVASVEVYVTDSHEPAINAVNEYDLLLSESSNSDPSSPYTHSIFLLTEPAGKVVINVASSDTGAVIVNTSEVELDATTYFSPGVGVSINTVEDDDAADESVVLTFSINIAKSEDKGYTAEPVTLTVEVDDDDTRGVTVDTDPLTDGAQSTIEVAEDEDDDGNTAEYTLVLHTQPTGNVKITPFIPLEEAHDAARVSGPLTFTPGNWNTPQKVTVNGVNDDIDNVFDWRTLFIDHRVEGADYGADYEMERGLTVDRVYVTVTDDDEEGLTVTPSTRTIANEDGGTTTYTVKLDTQPIEPVTVWSQSNDIHIVSVIPDSYIFDESNWNDPQTFTVTAVNDDIDNQGEERVATISHSASSDNDYDISASPVTVTVTVTDDDPDPTVSLVLDPASIDENGGRSTVTATLDRASDAVTTIIVSASPASGSNPAETSDFTLSSNRELTIAAGLTYSNVGTVTVTAVDDADTLPERVAISATATNAEGVVAPSDAILTISDHDAPGVTVDAPNLLEVTEGSTNTYTVVLAYQPESNVVISVASSNSEVTVNPDRLTFTPGNYSSAQTVTVTAADDPDAVMDTATITHRIVAADTSNEYDSVPVSGVNVEVAENDERGVFISTAHAFVDEDAGTDTYTVHLGSQPTTNVTVRPRSSDTGAARVAPPTLTFTTSNWNDPQTFTVTGVNDDIDNSNDLRQATITHTVSGGDYTGEAASAVNVNVNDDDERGITVTAAQPDTIPEAGGRATYTVALDSQPTGNVTVTPHNFDPTVVTVQPASLRFTPGNWKTARTVTITGVDDDIDNSNEQRETTILHNVSAPISDYAAESADDVSVSVTDDDADPTVTLVTSAALVENGDPVEITATQDIVSDADTTITVTVTEGPDTAPADFTVSRNTELTIAAGQTASTGLVNIWARRDADTAADSVIVTATATNSQGVADPSPLTVPIVEEADAGVTVWQDTVIVGEGSNSTYRIELDRQPLGDVVIRARVSGNSDVSVDTDPQQDGNQNTLTFTLENYESQIVYVHAAEDDDAADETATITHSIVASQSSNEYDRVTIDPVSVRVSDNDRAGVTVSESNMQIDEGESATYTVRLDTLPAGGVRISASSNSDAVTVSPSSFTLSQSNWKRGQTLTVHAPHDDDSVRESVTITHAIDASRSSDEYGRLSIDNVTMKVIDDETPVDYDLDNDGRIEITNSAQLDAVRYDLDGNGVADNAADRTAYAGAFPWIMEDMCSVDFTETAVEGNPGPCTSYELSSDITLSGNWTPIGGNLHFDDYEDPLVYRADFYGNGHTISNLSVSLRDRKYVGLFGAIGAISAISGSKVVIRDVGLENVNVLGRDHVGALAGRNSAMIRDAWSTGKVSGNAFVGGLVGWNMKGGSVERSYSEADVTGFNSSDSGGPIWSTRIAGLVGGNYGRIANTYATGSARGRGHVAGLTGENSHSKGISNGVSNDISNSYSIGAVSTEEDWPFKGGLVGWQTATVTGSYWDIETSGQSDGAGQGEVPGAVGLDTTALQTPIGPNADTDGDGNPDTYVGWSASVWNFREEDKYPCLIDVGDCPTPTAMQTDPPDTTTLPATRASVTVDAADPVAMTEGGSEATYTVVLDGQPTGNVTITMSSDNGDVTLEPSILTFTRDNWHTAQSVTVRAAQDGDAADDAATIRHAVGGASEYAGITVDTVAVAVSDDDTASITVQPTSLSLPEGFTGSYSISLSHLPVGEVRIFMLSDNPDVVPYPDQIIFTPENWQAERLVGVPAAHDDDATDDEALITHGILAATGSGYTGATVASVVVSITDDDEPATPGVTVSAADPVTVAEGGSATYQVSLDAPPTGDVTITVSSDNGDVTAQPDSLTFNPDNWQNAQTVTVSAAHDDDAVDDTAAVSHAVSGADEYAGIGVASVAVAVTDDDSAGVTVEPLTLMVIEGGDDALYTVVLDTEPSANVVIDVSSDNADVSTQPTELTFTTGDWQTAQTVTVSAGQDDDSDPDRASISHAVSGAAEYDGIGAAGVTVLVSDDDPITLPATESGSVTVEPLTLDITEGGDGASYTVSLDVEPSASVVIDVSSDNADVSTQPASLTFTTGDWQTAQTVTVSAAQDEDSDDETATVSHQVSGGNYDGVTAASVAVSVTDDDQETEEPDAEPVSVADPNRAALEAFYNATGGASWTNSANWLSNKPIGEWHGVTTNGQGEVTTIVLDGNNLTGSLPSQLGNLSSLNRLALNRNGLSGAIPSQLGSLPNLSIIGLARNQLSGALPTSLGNLPLTRLSLHDNTGLSGALPSGFTSLTSLQRLAIANTGICIPAGDAFTNWLAAVPDKPGIDGLTACASP